MHQVLAAKKFFCKSPHWYEPLSPPVRLRCILMDPLPTLSAAFSDFKDWVEEFLKKIIKSMYLPVKYQGKVA